MATSLQSPLSSAATSTFEELGFLLALPVDGDARPLAHGARVDFRGPRTGCLELRVSATLLPVVAANMLGSVDVPSFALQLDALGELANVITGNVVPALDGPRAVYRLDAPVLAARGEGRAAAAEVTLRFDEGDALVQLFLDEPARAA